MQGLQCLFTFPIAKTLFDACCAEQNRKKSRTCATCIVSTLHPSSNTAIVIVIREITSFLVEI